MNSKNKRNLYKELKSGLEEIHSHQSGKITLKSYAVEKKQCPQAAISSPPPNNSDKTQ
ncbi:MAG: hypothetical protein JSR17_02165 [Proteobacteria bacterium]|nr:hypothetical protein [Pseudomonadota bacterium]